MYLWQTEFVRYPLAFVTSERGPVVLGSWTDAGGQTGIAAPTRATVDAVKDSPIGRLQRAVGMVVAVGIVGTIGYMLFGMSFTDAVYPTVTTVTTVGFRELQDFDTAEQWFTEAASVDAGGANGLRARIGWGDARLRQGDVLGAAITWQSVVSASGAPDSLAQMAAARINALASAGPPEGGDIR